MSVNWSTYHALLSSKLQTSMVTEDVVYNHSVNGNTVIRAEWLDEDAENDPTLDGVEAHVLAADVEDQLSIGRTITRNSVIYTIREVEETGDDWVVLNCESRI